MFIVSYSFSTFATLATYGRRPASRALPWRAPRRLLAFLGGGPYLLISLLRRLFASPTLAAAPRLHPLWRAIGANLRSLVAVSSSLWSVLTNLVADTKGHVGVRASRPVTFYCDHVGILASRSVKHLKSSSPLLFVSFCVRPPTTRFRPLLVFMYAHAHSATWSDTAFVSSL